MGVAAPEARSEGKVHALAAKPVGELSIFCLHFFHLCLRYVTTLLTRVLREVVEMVAPTLLFIIVGCSESTLNVQGYFPLRHKMTTFFKICGIISLDHQSPSCLDFSTV